jgi:CobQ-like glutamine amidotransferase family enzyme
MISSQNLKLIHFFPDHMNIYGDMGNIIALRKRCEWRGIHVEYVAINTTLDFEKIATGDIFFFGGGQDTDQMRVWNIVSSQKELFIRLIKDAVAEQKVFLLVCGGYQMFGRYFIDSGGNAIPGLGVLDIETVSPGKDVLTRCIGNIAIQTNLAIEPQTIVGFENHGGQTQLSPGSHQEMQYFGKVLKGFGNNLSSGYEGCMYKNVIGTYLHGSLLPKNPHLADYLIAKALSVKYQEEIKMAPLHDTLEMKAHDSVFKTIV